MYAVLWDSEAGAVERARGAVDMVGARGRPEAVSFLLCDAVEGLGSVGVVLFDVGQASRVAFLERSATLACDAQNVMH